VQKYENDAAKQKAYRRRVRIAAMIALMSNRHQGYVEAYVTQLYKRFYKDQEERNA
jgi:hypothetical protein